MTQGQRRAIFIAACGIAAATIVAYVTLTSRPSDPTVASMPDGVEFVDAVPAGPLMMFRDTSPGSLSGRVEMVRLPYVAGAPRLVSPLSCDRVHYAAGHGVCMVSDETRLPVRYFAYAFDRGFAKGADIPLTGLPIRARVAADGRRAVLTVFERGHSYADESFSTKTIVVDTATGRLLGDLESFAVEKDGQPFKAVDFNFWGVTFERDGDGFFATLKTKRERYLVKGSVDARRMTVVRAGVECPSLSPDGSMIAFKKPLTREIGWRLHVLDLASGAEQPLNQVVRSVDDQVEWFDDRHVAYHDSAAEGTGIWTLSVDGVTPPSLLLANAYSPAVAR